MGLGSRRSTSWKNSSPRTISTPCAPCAACSIPKTAAIPTRFFPARNAAPTSRRRSKSPLEGFGVMAMFPTTHWSLLAKASLDGNTESRKALEELCRRYWVPLKQFIRSRDYSEAAAEDLTQEFLLHLLEH